ncbi:MAG: ATP-dependent DNA helicase RecG [Acidimicrobiaceae bacterium]|nr:ATP-dependent DNA helicase RecG [Acidimicrobiia bacterium]MCY4492902.1 ATP-dependent DNA helicase RecG [Acidimicrobiaceae bacterium]
MPAGDPPLTLKDLGGIKVAELAGVGERTANGLLALEIFTVLDLLSHYPRRYLDRTRQAQIGELLSGDEATVLGTVRSSYSRKLRGRRTLTQIVIGDGTGKLTLVFFNQQWRARQLTEGMDVLVHGKFERYRGTSQMTSPVVDLLGTQTGRIIPVYPQSDKTGLTTYKLAQLVEEALKRSRARGFADPVPPEVLDRFKFVDRETALHGIHCPETMEQLQQARRRLVFDELFRVQLELVRRKRAVEMQTSGISHDTSAGLVDRFHARLPFALTGAQQRVNEEIARDLSLNYPMHRLLQGDVGSGKTLVAATALLTAVQGGYQGALMAPTEVLAEQHCVALRDMLSGLSVPDPASLMGQRPLRVELLTGTLRAAERRKVLADLADRRVDIVIGTHALIQAGVQYQSLGLVVIDEQHRFGVEQRAALRDKGESASVPDVLVMTATPIPRTAAMTVYGDLDVSVLDEMPPGRSPIITSWAEGPMAQGAVWDTVRAEVADGRQAYVVCPVIEESAVIDVSSVEDTFVELHDGELSGLRVGLLHGRVSPAEKEATMAQFRSGSIDVLVATTVIEVGVDVPNATVMVIFDADRFGIAQLHQLRGRVGRGQHQGRCFLLGEPSTKVGRARLEALVESTDGFELAEVDLELRGEGTIMGERQKGRNDLRLASLRRDKEWVELARSSAVEILAEDPELTDCPELKEEVDFMLGDDEAEFLMKS